MAWSSHILSSGSRDRNILQRDVRAPEDYIHKLVGHRSEVWALPAYPSLQKVLVLILEHQFYHMTYASLNQAVWHEARPAQEMLSCLSKSFSVWCGAGFCLVTTMTVKIVVEVTMVMTMFYNYRVHLIANACIM